jgi:FkbM family methyltransferase
MRLGPNSIKALAKAWLKETPWLGDLALWLNCHVLGGWKEDAACWLRDLTSDEALQVVQIGSNDGRTADPIYMLMKRRKRWRGLFVEPVPYLFERLQKNYGQAERFVFEQAVIGDGREATFYWVDPAAKQHFPDLPPWYDMMASFDRNHILKQLNGILEPFIVSEKIRSLTLPELLAKHRIQRLDLLHIDAEGNDWQILQQLDLDRFKPLVILFEHTHLNASQRAQAQTKLLPEYRMFTVGEDVMAVRRPPAGPGTFAPALLSLEILPG